MVNSYIMPTGKHKGKSLKNIPSDYLRWVYNNWDFKGNPNFKTAIQTTLMNKGIMLGAQSYLRSKTYYAVGKK